MAVKPCQVCHEPETRLYAGGHRCERHSPDALAWHDMMTDLAVREARGAFAPAMAEKPAENVVFASGTPVAYSDLPSGAKRLHDAAQRAGWAIRIQGALAGTVETRRVKIIMEEDARKGARSTRDETHPVVVSSVAVICHRGHQRTVTVWRDGRFDSASALGPFTGSLGLREMIAFTERPVAPTLAA